LTGDERVVLGSFHADARAARGVAVVIDVFRAFTTAAVAFANGAESIAIVGDLETALDLRARGVGRYCLGERGGLRPDGFDFGNSPVEILDRQFDGETLIQTTSNGTKGLLAASGADAVYAGSLAIADATVEAVRSEPQAEVHFIAMGADDVERAEEDELCALYMRARLAGRRPDVEAIRRVIETTSGRMDSVVLSAADIDFCLTANRYDFAIRVAREDGLTVARKHPKG
jgi:2-phosphosulfolactate phosphatase